MASQSLYRKWRSQTFDDLIGQEPIVRTLKNALSSGNPAHAYLFTGPRGTGKTSTARLLAKAINCANPIDGEPCNECQQCREITAGNSFNVIEIDAASNRGIDSIRDLREKVMMPPATGKYKVYVLDEAHMLTPEAFNALLKTLEEPPSYAIFVLATTDVHKMLPTVLSRCQRFDFKRITSRQIVERLHFVADQEHVNLERSAAELLARAAAGGMRDALSLLDQAIAYCGEEISLSQVQAMLGVADPRGINKLIIHISQLDSSAGLHLIHELSEAGADLRQINAQMVEYWRALLLAKAGADIASILDLTEDEIREVKQTAQLFSLEELTESARIFAQNDLIQKHHSTPQLGLELAFLECIEIHRHAQSGQLSIGSVTPAPAIQARPAATPPASRAGASQPVAPEQFSPPLETRPAQKASTQKPQESFSDWSPAQQEEPAPSIPVNGNNATALAPSPASQDKENQPSLTLQQVKDVWLTIKKRVRSKNQLTGANLEHCTPIAVEGTADQPVIVIQAGSDMIYKNISKSERVQYIEWAAGLEFNQKCRVRLVPPGQSLFPSAGNTSTYSANTAFTVASQQPAHVQRPASTSPASANSIEPESANQPASENKSVPDKPLDTDRPRDGLNLASAPPLARTNILRENNTGVVLQESIEQKARRDPVVQEVMKTFTAKIVEIRPK